MPNDKEVWVLHDSGISSEKKYDLYRKGFCEKYEGMGFVYTAADDTIYTKIGYKLEKKKKDILENYRCEKEEIIWQAIADFENLGYADMEVMNLKNYLEVNRNERQRHGISKTCKRITYQEFGVYYTQIKFWIWRSDFSWNHAEESKNALWALINNGMLTIECLKLIQWQISCGNVCKTIK